MFNGVTIFNLETKENELFIDTSSNSKFKHLAFSNDGSYVASGGSVWNLNDGKKINTTYQGYNPSFSYDNSKIFSWVPLEGDSIYDDADLIIKDLQTNKVLDIFGEEYKKLLPNNSATLAYAVSIDGKLLANSGERPGIWDIKTGERIQPLSSGRYGYIFDMEFLPDGKHLAGMNMENLLIWKIGESGIKNSFDIVDSSEFYKMKISSDSRFIILLGRYGNVKLLNLLTEDELFNTHVSSTSISDASFSPNNEFIATIDSNNLITIIEITTGKIVEVIDNFYGESSFVNGLRDFKISNDGQFLATLATFDRSVKIWDTDTLQLLQTLHFSDTPFCFDISSNGELISVGQASKGAMVWNAHTGDLLQNLLPEEKIIDLDFSKNNKFLAIATNLKVIVYETNNWKESAILKPQLSDFVLGVEFSPDSQSLIVVSSQSRVWNTNNWTIRKSFDGKVRYIGNVEFSNDGKYLAMSEANNEWTRFHVNILSATNYQVLDEIPVTTPTNYMLFSPDNSFLLLGDGTYSKNEQNLLIYDTNWNAIGKLNYFLGPITISQDNMVLVLEDSWENICFLGIP